MIRKLFDKTFWRFLLVGILNTIVGTSVMFICYNIVHFNYWTSSAMNYIIGSIVSYFLNKYFTFQYKKQSWKNIIRFITNISICYLIAYGIAKPLAIWGLSSQPVHIQENIAMLIGMCLFVGFNYLGQRFWVFKNSEN